MNANPFDPGYYDENELMQLGFGRIGRNVRIAKNCTLINLDKLFISSNVRIDGPTTIVAGPERVTIGNFIHIGGSVVIIGGAGVVLEDFCNLSHGVRIYSRSDDFTEGAFTNPMVPKEYTRVKEAPVFLRKHTIVGSGSIILPGITLEVGTSVGALSLISSPTVPWGVYGGVPASKLSMRKPVDRDIEAKLLASVT